MWAEPGCVTLVAIVTGPAKGALNPPSLSAARYPLQGIVRKAAWFTKRFFIGLLPRQRLKNDWPVSQFRPTYILLSASSGLGGWTISPDPGPIRGPESEEAESRTNGRRQMIV